MKINKMPTRELLEDYLESSSGVKVYFDSIRGEFVRNSNLQIDNTVLNNETMTTSQTPTYMIDWSN